MPVAADGAGLAAALVELQELTRRLRSECPWDREQTAQTIVPHTVEEAYEVADAALAGDSDKLLDELGDLLFQTYFLALLLEEKGEGDLEAVARGVHAKLVRRHPHVFGEAEANTAGRVRERWEAIKTEQEGRSGIFHDVPEALPGLLLARKVQRRAASVGFRLARPRRAAREGPARRSPRSRRSLSAPAVPLPRRRPIHASSPRSAISCSRSSTSRRVVNVDPELALRATTGRFVARVERAEQLAAAEGLVWSELDLDAQDAWYERAKADLGGQLNVA